MIWRLLYNFFFAEKQLTFGSKTIAVNSINLKLRDPIFVKQTQQMFYYTRKVSLNVTAEQLL
jgi:hypothetical protein